jgi:hypothetical protein
MEERFRTSLGMTKNDHLSATCSARVLFFSVVKNKTNVAELGSLESILAASSIHKCG